MAQKKVRFLVDHPVEGVEYKANQLVEFEAKLADTLEKGGVVDASKEAVTYCESEGAKPVKHEKPKLKAESSEEGAE